jgi:hypothetical protein
MHRFCGCCVFWMRTDKNWGVDGSGVESVLSGVKSLGPIVGKPPTERGRHCRKSQERIGRYAGKWVILAGPVTRPATPSSALSYCNFAYSALACL